MISPLALDWPGMDQWLIVAVVGLLFFGKRLPEVGRSLGKGIVEFKKGLKGIEEEVSAVDSPTASPTPAIAQNPAHKFDPVTGQPIASARFDPFTGQPLAVERSEAPATLPPST